MTEREEAEKIANAILDGGCDSLYYITSGDYADPDDDIHILARQFLRSLEKEKATETGRISDGRHAFDELYEHRHALFIALCRLIPAWGWRSRLHADGSMFDGWFVMGLCETAGNQMSYHLPMRLWDRTDFVKTLDRAPEWDGHTPFDVIERLYTI